MRKLFWLELRDNAVSLRGLSPSTRVLGTIGFVLLATMVASLVFNDVWRAFPLIDAPPGQDGRGTLVPIALVPVTLLLVSVGCAFMLAGAMRARPAIAVVTLFALIFMLANWSSNGADYTTWDSVLAWGPLA